MIGYNYHGNSVDEPEACLKEEFDAGKDTGACFGKDVMMKREQLNGDSPKNCIKLHTEL